MTRGWDYKTMKLTADGSWLGGKIDETKLEARLNELGRDGWELISAFDTNMAQGQTRDVIAIFKRAR
jgi:hypothetical protein